MHALKVIISFIFAFYFVPLHPLTYSNGIMRVTYYDKDGKVTETKDFGDKASDVVLNYDDAKLFFQIPESIIKSARSTKDKLERLYLLEQLRFLIEYDYELYTKSELCDKQDVEMSCYLRDIGCKDIEGMKPTQSDNDSNYQPNPVFAEMRDRLFRHATNLSDIRHRLINTTKRNNIQYSKIVRDPQSKDSGYNQVYLYSDELTPEVCYLMSLLAPLGDISEKQIYEESLFKDNKFLLSISRALYRTNGINRSVFYNLLRLFMPTTYKTNQLQGVLGFSHKVISTENNNLIITCRDGLNNTLSEISISRKELADMFAVSDGANIIDNILDILKLNYGIFVDNSKDDIERELLHDVWIGYKKNDCSSWGDLLANKYIELRNGYSENCNDINMYLSPFFIYGIVLRYDRIDTKTEISIPMTKDVVFGCIKSEDNNVLPLYQTLYSLNYIKERAGLIEKENEYCHSAAIDKAIKYIEPIANNIFLNTAKVSPKEFLDLFKRILSADPMNELIEESTFWLDYNQKMVLNIIGLLNNYEYFVSPVSVIAKKLGEKYSEEQGKKSPDRRYYIGNWNTKNDKGSYILEMNIKEKIENIVENFKKQKK